MKATKFRNRADVLDLSVALTDAFEQLRLTKARCARSSTELSTTAAIEYELRLKDGLLWQLGKIRSFLSRYMTSNARRKRLAFRAGGRPGQKRRAARLAHGQRRRASE